MNTTTCPDCGKAYGVGQWYRCPHDAILPSKGFEPRFDIGLGREVTGWGDIKQAMRKQKLDFRDHPSHEATDRYYDRARRAREGRRDA
jgi:hypothetical protein